MSKSGYDTRSHGRQNLEMPAGAASHGEPLFPGTHMTVMANFPSDPERHAAASTNPAAVLANPASRFRGIGGGLGRAHAYVV